MHKDDPEVMARMHAWLHVVEQEVGLDASLLSALESSLLELISDVAHGPSRPGAPLTAFLVGVGVGRGADGPVLIERVRELVRESAGAE
jgi:hypothetical protein